jgi:vitamin B12 transporter
MSRIYLFALVFAVAMTTAMGARAESAGKVSADANSAAQPSQSKPSPLAKGSAGNSKAARAGSAPQQSSTGQNKLSESAHAKPKLPNMVIVVTATRIPTPIGELGTAASVVSGKSIQSQQIRQVDDALRETPSLQVFQTGSPGNSANVSIRGASSSQTLVMIDGVPVNDSATSSFDMSRLTTDDLNRIEVVRGSGGALYGSQAIGGVINLITQEGSGTPRFSLLSLGGNRATENQALTFGGTEGKLNFSGSVSYFSTSGYRITNDNSDNLSGVLRLDYHLSDNTTIRSFARYTRANVGLANFSNFENIANNPNAHQRNEFIFYKGEIDHKFGDRLLTRSTGFFVRDELRLNQVPFLEQAKVPFGALNYETDHVPDETRGSNQEAIYTWNENFRSVVGFDFKDRWVHSQDDTFYLDPPFPLTGCGAVAKDFRCLTVFNARRQEYAGYIEQEGRFFNGHLIGTGGFRVDGNSQFGKEVSPAWSVAMPFLRYGVTLRGSYSEGFRAPSFDELYFPGFGNPNLSPEISSEWDGGITKTFGEIAEVSVNYFSRRVHDLIVTVPCTFNPVSCPFGSMDGNAGRVDTQGIEFIPSVHPMRGLTFSGSFTYLDETHSSVSPTTRPTRVPKYSAQALIDYTHSEIFGPDDRFITTLAYTFVGDRDDITSSGTIASHDAYDLFNLSAIYSAGIPWGLLRNESVIARVQNLFDRNYSETFGFRSPPVNFLAGVKLEF